MLDVSGGFTYLALGFSINYTLALHDTVGHIDLDILW